MKQREGEGYLGDGLYASFDMSVNFPVLWLRAPRAGGDHEVALEPHVLLNAFRFIKEKKPELLTSLLESMGYVEEHEDVRV